MEGPVDFEVVEAEIEAEVEAEVEANEGDEGDDDLLNFTPSDSEDDLVGMAPEEDSTERGVFSESSALAFLKLHREELVDVFQELGTSSPGIVDGDGLLHYFLAHDRSIDKKHGGQPLQICYRILRLMNRLIACKVQVTLVFFADTGAAWQKHPLALAIRHLLIVYLSTQNTIAMQVFSGDHYDPDFQLFLHQCLPGFLVTNVVRKAHDVAPLVNAFASYSIGRNQTIIQLSGSNFSGFRLKAWVMWEGSYRTSPRKDRVEYHASVLADRASRLRSAVSPIQFPSEGVWMARELLALATITQLKPQEPTDQFLARLYLLHACLLSHFPPHRRAHAASNSDNQIINEFLERCSSALALQLEANPQGLSVDQSLMDAFDGRFFYVLFLLLGRGSGDIIADLPKPVRDKWHSLCVFSEIKIGELVIPPRLGEGEDPSSDYKAAVKLAAASVPSPLRSLNSAFLGTSFVRDVFPEEAQKNLSSDSDWTSLYEADKGVPYIPNRHWANAALINAKDEDDDTTPVEKTPKLRDHERDTRIEQLVWKLYDKLLIIPSAKWDKTAPKKEQKQATSSKTALPPKNHGKYPGKMEKDTSFGATAMEKEVIEIRRELVALNAEFMVKVVEEQCRGPYPTKLPIDRLLKRAFSAGRQATMAARAKTKFALSLQDGIIHRDPITEDEPIEGLNKSKDRKARPQTNEATSSMKSTQISIGILHDNVKLLHDAFEAIKVPQDRKRALLEMLEKLLVLGSIGKWEKPKNGPKKSQGGADKAETQLDGLKALQKNLLSLLFEIHLKMLKADMENWRLTAAKGSQAEEEWQAGRILFGILELPRWTARFPTEPPTPWHGILDTAPKKVAKMLAELGFRDDARALRAFSPKKISKLPEGRDRVHNTVRSFQVHAMADLLQRPEGEPDPRVRRFRPDTWQRKLLDIVDRRESAVVCAPTSAGKTFIAFYCMEKVLREKSQGEGLVVYVSPTKALVNQVEADIYARFSKTFDTAGRHLCGVFTREYRSHEKECQILVTVPDCLEILLVHAQNSGFANRLRWVIFDEVHSISSPQGHVWERLLVSCPCPFLALAATIGNPVTFQSWLSSLRDQSSRPVRLITYDQRYNHLQLHVYNADTRQCIPLNPCALLQAPSVARSGNPATLLPEQTLALYEALKKSLEQNLPQTAELLKRLQNNPDSQRIVGASDEGDPLQIITTDDVERFRKHVNKILQESAQHNQSLAVSALARLPQKQIPEITDARCGDWKLYQLQNHILSCLRSLSSPIDHLNRLPAIVFHLSIPGCDQLVRGMYHQLAMAQRIQSVRKFAEMVCRSIDMGARPRGKTVAAAKMCVTMPEFAPGAEDITVQYIQPKVKAVLDVLRPALARYRSRQTGLLLAKYKAASAAYEQQMANPDKKARPLRPPDAPNLEQYKPWYIDPNFALGTQRLTLEDLREHLEDDGLTMGDVMRDWRLAAMMRGIGVHYAQLTPKMKKLNERLFRSRKLAVIVATGTLAVGINMPCRTVIFAGNSEYLNTVQFHQMSGRAGRRSFDKRGHVVIMGISAPKLTRLVLSPIPQLIGSGLITPVLALRHFIRYHYSSPTKRLSGFEPQGPREREEIIFVMRKLVEKPMCGHAEEGRNLFESQLPEICLYFFDWLITQGALEISSAGELEPTAMCSFLAHLFFLEPANVVFVTALYAGLFDSVLQSHKPDANGNFSHELHVLVLTLVSYLLLPQPVRRATEIPSNTEGCMVVLPPPSQAFCNHINSYNASVLKAYTELARRLVANRAATDPIAAGWTALPGETTNFPDGGELPNCTLAKSLAPLRLPSEARSPFTALSGRGDKFKKIQELTEDLPHGVFLEKDFIPVFCNDADEPFSAYIVDFFNSHNKKWLSKYHKIKPASQYDVFFGVNHALRVVAEALQRRVGVNRPDSAARNHVYLAFRNTAEAFNLVFQEQYGNRHKSLG